MLGWPFASEEATASASFTPRILHLRPPSEATALAPPPVTQALPPLAPSPLQNEPWRSGTLEAPPPKLMARPSQGKSLYYE